MKTKKKFDCIKMKDEAQQTRAERLRGLSPQERLEFYKREHASLLARKERMRKSSKSS